MITLVVGLAQGKSTCRSKQLLGAPQMLTVGPSGSIRTLAWNNKGTLIATGAADRTVRIWNPERPHIKHSTELRGHTGAVSNVAWNPTKDYEVASCSTDGTVKVWDIRSKSCVSDVTTGGEPFTMAWRPNGSVLMVGRKDDALLPIHFPPGPANVGAGQLLHQPVQTNQTSFSHSGLEMFLSTGSGSVSLVTYPDMEPLATLNGHTSSCLCLELDPTARFLAVGGSDALISLWEMTDGFVRRGLDGMTGPVRSVSFNHDGAYVCGGSDEGTGIKIVGHSFPTYEAGPMLTAITSRLTSTAATTSTRSLPFIHQLASRGIRRGTGLRTRETRRA